MSTIAPSGTVTFLFTDVEGSTAAWERSPQTMRAELAVHDAMCRQVVASNGGYLFKTLGDGMCAAFGSAADALKAAISLQRELAAHVWPPEVGPLRVRAAIHTGTAVELEGDYFGPAVNRTARLMSIAHGGQVLVSQATAILMRDEPGGNITLRDLGSHKLKDLAEPEHAFQVVADGLASEFAPLTSMDARPNNLPSYLSSFVGRERELNDLRALMQESKLVTIAGPGGIGKTRLALQFAAENLESYPHGTWFVDLAGVTDPNLVAHAVASAAGVREIPAEPIERTLIEHLANKSVLLIQDNSEHLLEATAALARDLLRSLPNLRILVTSRQPLHVEGERTYRLGSIVENDGVSLFRERARAVDSGMTFDEDAVADARAICAKLEGIPLAIELAAARVSILALPELRERLASQLSLLVSRGPAGDRHRTLRGTIEWSYRLLEPEERQTLEDLAVFAGGFSLAAFEAVVNRRPHETVDVLDSLVDKSFVVAERRAAGTRYRLLDAIREFASAQSEDNDERGDASSRHRAYYLGVAAGGSEALAGAELAAWLTSIDDDIANVRAALDSGFRTMDPGLAKALRGLWRYWIVRRKVTEGRQRLQRYLETASEDEPLYPFILRRAASLASIAGDHSTALSSSKRALELFEKAHNAPGQAEALQSMAVSEHRFGNLAGAAELYEAAASKFQTVNDRRGSIVVKTNGAQLYMLSGDLQTAAALLDECSAQAAEYGDLDISSSVEAVRGTLDFRLGRPEQAEALFEKALRGKQQIGNEYGQGEVLNALAAVTLRRGDVDRAAEDVRESLRLAIRTDSPALAIESLETQAAIDIAQDAQNRARSALALAHAMRKKFAYNIRTTLLVEDTEKRVFSAGAEAFERAKEGALQTDWQSAVQTYLLSS